MAKKQTSCKNPVAQAFGMALRKQRDIMGKTSKEIASTLAIGSSYYRLVESGTNNLHVSKAVPLVDAFDGKLHFDGVSKILMAISYMESSGKKAIADTHYAEGLKGAVEKLSIYDEDKLRLLLEPFRSKKLFDRIRHVASDDIGNEIVSHELDVIVSDFITSYDTFGRSDEQLRNDYLLKSLNEVPSIYFDFVTTTVQNLNRLPRYVGYKAVWQWEDQNKEDFKEMICLTNKPESIVSPENLQRYKFKHLWEGRFSEAKFIVLTDITPSKLKKDFARLLRQSLRNDKNTEKLKKFQSSVDKVIFKTLSADNDAIERARSLLSGDDYANPQNAANYDAIWVFTLKGNKNVGFIAEIDYESDVHKNQLVHVVSLTYSQVSEKVKILNEIWGKLPESL